MKIKHIAKYVTRWDWYVAAAMAVLVVIIFEGFIFSDKMIFGTDMIPMGYMMRKVVADYWRSSHSIPLWNPYILCGLPVVDAMHGDVFYPAALAYLFMPLHKALGYKIVVHVWLAGVAMYALLRTLGLRRRSSLLGGVSYMVAPYFLSLIYAGHDGKMFVTALFPLCVAALELLIRHVRYIYAVLFGALLGLLFLTSHPQMTYFAAWGLAIYFVFNVRRLVRTKMLGKGLLFMVVALLIGIGIGCVQFLPTYYYTTNFSPRTGGVSFAFASSWSLHPEEIVSLLYPMFGGYQDFYWGRNPFKLNAESPGPLVLLIAIGGFLFCLRRKEALPWLFLFVFCPLYALGAHTPLLKAAFYAIPGAKFLRAPSIIMFMFSCASSVLAAFFVDGLLSRQASPFQKKLLTGLVIFVIFMTFMLTVARTTSYDIWQTIYGRLGEGKLSIIKASGALLTRDAIILGLFGVGLLLLAGSRYRTWREGGGLVALAIMGILATSLPHSVRFIQYVGLRDWQRSDAVIDYIRKDKDIFRALPVIGSNFYNRNYMPIFGIETANGFYDNRIRYYDTLAGASQENLANPNIMRITNVKYVVTAEKVEHPLLVLERDFGKVFVYRNAGFLPRAFLVHSAVVASGDSAALNIIRNAAFDPSTTIVLASGEPISGEAAGEEGVRIETYVPDKVRLRATVTSPAYLYFSENYLPYWKAYVDGKQVPLVRSNVAMRAVYLEPGEHTVEMKFFSKWYRAGAYICLVACAVVVASGVAFCRRPVRRRKDA
jgi:hypothetical protein